MGSINFAHEMVLLNGSCHYSIMKVCCYLHFYYSFWKPTIQKSFTCWWVHMVSSLRTALAFMFQQRTWQWYNWDSNNSNRIIHLCWFNVIQFFEMVIPWPKCTPFIVGLGDGFLMLMICVKQDSPLITISEFQKVFCVGMM